MSTPTTSIGIVGIVGIVGGGAVAHALAAALSQGAGDRELKVWARRRAASSSVAALGGPRASSVKDLQQLSGCAILLIAVSDSALGEVAAQLAAELSPLGGSPRAIFHTGGARTGADSLAPLQGTGAALGSLHPLVAVAADAAPEPDVFASRPFMVEATSREAAEAGRGLVQAMGGFEVQLPESASAEEASELKARYHALATMVATGVVTLVDRAALSMASTGQAADQESQSRARAAFRRAYGALAASAVQNVLRDDGARVLTGAIARHDEDLVEQHHAALKGDVSASLYRAVEGAARGMLRGGETTSSTGFDSDTTP